MNVLIVGNGKGSWTMRGQQLGAAIGARVTTYPTASDWTWADVAVLVKRSALTYAHLAHQAGVRVVWDAIDFWKQPSDNAFGRVGALDTLRWHLEQIRPSLTIGATRAMADACQGVYLPHHSWANLDPAPAREQVQTVAYEGNPIYLGQWHKRLQDACTKRGWRFIVNPPDLREVDILVGFREGQWDGFMCREWKSGVKVGNAVAAGRPFIGQSTAALREIGCPSTVVDEAYAHLIDAALDEWTPLAARAAAVDACRQLAPQFTLHAIAAQYVTVLERAMETSCAA